MLVRTARPEDATSARQLVSDAGLPVAGLGQAWTTVVGEDADEDIVGVVALERHGPPGARAFLLRSLAVRPARRGSGLGAALVRAVLAAADADDGHTATVALLTETADGYFRQVRVHPC